MKLVSLKDGFYYFMEQTIIMGYTMFVVISPVYDGLLSDHVMFHTTKKNNVPTYLVYEDTIKSLNLKHGGVKK